MGTQKTKPSTDQAAESTKPTGKTDKKLVIIDGHAMAFRAHYALINQRLTNSKGAPTETIFGFFRMTAKLIRDLNPDYFLIIFDPPGPNFRHELYPAYKETRKETPEELKVQLSELQQIATSLGLPVIIPGGYEADDMIASAAKKYSKEGLNVVIVSGDKDLFSIIDNKIALYRPVKGVSEFKEFHEADIPEEIGVTPGQVFDYMAITGDSSDNVPGVPGIGPKGAAKLINEYGSLNGIYENLEKIKPDGVRNKLTENKELAFISLDLVTLKTDLDPELSLEQITWDPDNKVAPNIAILKEKEFSTLYDEWGALCKNAPGGGSSLTTNSSILQHYTIVRSKNDWDKLLEEIETDLEAPAPKADAGNNNNRKLLAVDTETTSVRPMSAQLVGISLGWRSGDLYKSAYIPASFDTHPEHTHHFDYQDLPSGKEVIEWVKPLLENNSIAKVGQNIKYDYLVLKRHGIELKPVYQDTMVLSYMLSPNTRGHNLDDMALRHLGHTTITYKELAGVGKKQLPLVELPIEPLARYACEDAEVTARLHTILSAEITKAGLVDLYNKIDGPMIQILAVMEENGILIDQKYLNQLKTKYEQKLNGIEKSIHEMAGEEFNINSTKELQEILFNKLDIKSKKKTSGGALSTNAAVLESIRDQHPIVEQLLEYRTLSKLLSTYINTLPEYAHPESGRVHTSFSQTIAATGRLASSDPNLQNIPIKGEEGRAIRKAFIAAENCELLSLDYSQIELRILAHYSNDPNLIAAFKHNEDIHDQATYLLFNQQFDPSTGKWNDTMPSGLFHDPKIDTEKLAQMKKTDGFRDRRGKAKILNFSIVYGVTEYGLSKSMGITNAEARSLIELYFHTYPGIREYMDNAVVEAKETGLSANYFGRKRGVDEINTKNRFVREAAERLAINNPIQSTAADLIKLAMIGIQNEIEKQSLKSKMLLQIHDELLFEVPFEEKEIFEKLARDKMENVLPLEVPLVVSGGFGKNWEEAK